MPYSISIKSWNPFLWINMTIKGGMCFHHQCTSPSLFQTNYFYLLSLSFHPCAHYFHMTEFALFILCENVPWPECQKNQCSSVNVWAACQQSCFNQLPNKQKLLFMCLFASMNSVFISNKQLIPCWVTGFMSLPFWYWEVALSKHFGEQRGRFSAADTSHGWDYSSLFTN